jgi:hypothetical protein
MFRQVKTGDGQKLKSDLWTKDGHSSNTALNWPEIRNSIYSTNEISMYLTDYMSNRRSFMLCRWRTGILTKGLIFRMRIYDFR